MNLRDQALKLAEQYKKLLDRGGFEDSAVYIGYELLQEKLDSLAANLENRTYKDAENAQAKLVEVNGQLYLARQNLNDANDTIDSLQNKLNKAQADSIAAARDLGIAETRAEEYRRWAETIQYRLDGQTRIVNELRKMIVELGYPINKLTPSEERMALDNKINAIKAHRTRTGLSLRESKDIVEKFLSDDADRRYDEEAAQKDADIPF